MFKLKSIRHKMIIGFSSILVLVVLFGIYNFIAVNKMVTNSEEIIENEVPVLISNQQMAYTIANQRAVARAYISTGDAIYKESFDEYAEKRNIYVNLMKESLGDEFDPAAANATTEWSNNVIAKVFDKFDNGERTAARENLNELIPEGEELMSNFEEWVAFGEDNIQTTGKQVSSQGQMTVIAVNIIILIVVIAGIGIAWFTSNKITVPLRAVMDRMKEITAGNLRNEPLKTKSHDEIAELMTATNEMNLQMRNLLKDIQSVSTVINKDSNRLKVSADEVKVGSEQISVTMEELASGSERQSQHATELSGSIAGFLEKVEETSKNGEQVEQFSSDVLEMAETGTNMMETSSKQMTMIDGIFHDAVHKVSELDRHSNDISELVSVIKAIAEQTNLLALNAAIEAARAGESGKGFAVVADEVRKLAEQVTNSVSNITEIVSRIQTESSLVASSLQDGYQEVEKGTEQAKSTKDTFEQINSNINVMVDHIHIITNNLQGIEKETFSMNDAFQDIAAISQESAASIEETTAQTQQTTETMEDVALQTNDLKTLADKLEENIAKFTI